MNTEEKQKLLDMQMDMYKRGIKDGLAMFSEALSKACAGVKHVGVSDVINLLDELASEDLAE